MDKNAAQNTISNSKEESIAKAIQLLQGECLIETPLQRPDISMLKVLGGFLLWISVVGVFLFFCLHMEKFFHIPTYVSYLIAVSGCLLIIIVKAKRLVCNAVLLYQKYAPEKLRRSCLFVPSCSDYMLLSVEKYGVIVGVYKGFRRLCRCHHPNGGEDYP